jgi:hypothetical protein
VEHLLPWLDVVRNTWSIHTSFIVDPGSDLGRVVESQLLLKVTI